MTLDLRMPTPAPATAPELTIVADQLTKIYRVQKKPPGLVASLRAVFQREYAEVRAVDGVSLTIRRGELVGFLGPNGAGKTTTLKMMAGLLEPTRGTVRVLGHEPLFNRQGLLINRLRLLDPVGIAVQRAQVVVRVGQGALVLGDLGVLPGQPFLDGQGLPGGATPRIDEAGSGRAGGVSPLSSRPDRG